VMTMATMTRDTTTTSMMTHVGRYSPSWFGPLARTACRACPVFPSFRGGGSRAPREMSAGAASWGSRCSLLTPFGLSLLVLLSLSLAPCLLQVCPGW
jgi:hypothetical protein